MTAANTDLFKGRHFDHEFIILCVRWYLSYKLSSRDLVFDRNGRVTAILWAERSSIPLMPQATVRSTSVDFGSQERCLGTGYRAVSLGCGLIPKKFKINFVTS
jgi:hypothetical protein